MALGFTWEEFPKGAIIFFPLKFAAIVNGFLAVVVTATLTVLLKWPDNLSKS
jgi:hypothetical protein